MLTHWSNAIEASRCAYLGSSCVKLRIAKALDKVFQRSYSTGLSLFTVMGFLYMRSTLPPLDNLRRTPSQCDLVYPLPRL
jgi:hypothetical protein